MESTLILLAVCLMFSNTHGESQSMSCSTINGQTICDKQTSQGNFAASGSSAFLGPGFRQQDTMAMAGNPGNMGYSSQSVNNGQPSGGYSNPSFGFQAPPGAYGGPPSGSSFSSSSSSSSPNSNYFSGPGAVGGFGFASAGSFPFPAYPGIVYPPQGPSPPSGNPPPQTGGPGPSGGSYSSSSAGGYAGSYAGGFAGPGYFNPMDFVFGGGRFPGMGAGAGAGAFAFGRR